MGKANFPSREAPLGTPPSYTPEAWAIQMRVRGVGPDGADMVEWRKHPNRQACELSIRALKQPRWVERIQVPVVFEIWHYYALQTNPGWALEETRIYRNGEVFVA